MYYPIFVLILTTTIQIMKTINELTETEKQTLNYLTATRNDFYNRGFNELAAKVQKDMDKLMTK